MKSLSHLSDKQLLQAAWKKNTGKETTMRCITITAIATVLSELDGILTKAKQKK